MEKQSIHQGSVAILTRQVETIEAGKNVEILKRFAGTATIREVGGKLSYAVPLTYLKKHPNCS